MLRALASGLIFRPRGKPHHSMSIRKILLRPAAFEELSESARKRETCHLNNNNCNCYLEIRLLYELIIIYRIEMSKHARADEQKAHVKRF